MSRGPSTMRAVINDLPMFRTPDGDQNLARATQLAGFLGTAHEAGVRYRTAVLAHHDLARRLCILFRYGHPEQWNGYVPPRTDGYGAYNPSPFRAAQIEIVLEALTRQDDWRHYDSDRLARVPAGQVRAPWTENRDATPRQEAGLWPESGQ